MKYQSGRWQHSNNMNFETKNHDFKPNGKFFIPYIRFTKKYIWRPPSLIELTPMIFNMGLTHLGYLGSETSIYTKLLISSMYLTPFPTGDLTNTLHFWQMTMVSFNNSSSWTKKIKRYFKGILFNNRCLGAMQYLNFIL